MFHCVSNAAAPAIRISGLIVGFVLIGLIVKPLQAANYVEIPARAFQSVLPTADTPLDVNVAAVQMRTEPVTVGEFLKFVIAHPEWRRDRVPVVFAESRYLEQWPEADAIEDGHSQQPVTRISWFAAQAFCENEGGRLPTWHEWELVAAADATRTDARNDPEWRNRILAWYSTSSADTPNNVGGEANAYGVRDMHGLAWEWVDDFNALIVSADNREQGDPDTTKFCGAGALSMQDRDNYAVLMRIAMLSSLQAADVTGNVGFRCVRPAAGGLK
jgi:formylglycine-generating enzyme required for sulfatase activity